MGNEVPAFASFRTIRNAFWTDAETPSPHGVSPECPPTDRNPETLERRQTMLRSACRGTVRVALEADDVIEILANADYDSDRFRQLISDCDVAPNIPPRYDRLARNFLAAVQLTATISYWL